MQVNPFLFHHIYSSLRFKIISFMKYCIYFFLCILSFSSCSKEENVDPVQQFDKEIEQIEKYLKDNNLTAEKTIHGLYYIIETPGGSEKPKITNTLTVNYKGYFLDKKEFDSGVNSEFGLFQVIEGWQIGIPKFGKGGKGKLLVPSRLGYGSKARGSIPANSTLIFDIELLDWR